MSSAARRSACTCRSLPGRGAARWMGSGVLAVLVAYAALVVALNSCASTPLRIDPLERRCGEPVVDADLALAREHAPWIYNEIDATGGRQDLPAPVDYDGNLDGDDNWENFPYCELVPTVSYAHLETATHHFLTYHVFHPRDWEPFDLGLHMTHEGDGENLQVVVEKAGGEVVMLFTQAHYSGRVHCRDGAGFASGEEPAHPTLLLIDDEGRPNAHGKHAAVFIEARGHGIYGALDRSARVEVSTEGRARFARKGLVFRPGRSTASTGPSSSGNTRSQ